MGQQANQSMTLFEKVETANVLSIIPEMIMLPFMHHDVGYERASIKLLLFLFALLTGATLIWPSPLTDAMAVAMFALGFWQNFTSHRAVSQGLPAGETLSNGISWLRLLPLPGFLLDEDRVERWLDPLVLLAVGIVCFNFADHETGVWIMISAAAMRTRERWEYKQRDHQRALRHNAGIIAQSALMETYEREARWQRSPLQSSVQRPALPSLGEDMSARDKTQVNGRHTKGQK